MTVPRGSLAVVTGGASGIGLALAEAYAARGSRVLIGDVDSGALEIATGRLAASGAEVHTAEVDLRSSGSITAFVKLAGQLGPIGAVCLNAGVTSTGATVWNTEASVLDFMLEVNLRGLFFSIKGFIPALIAQGTPADIVITASMAGMVTSPYSGAYAASKAGAIALAKSLRRELDTDAPYLRVAVLNPGMVKTNLMKTSAAHFPSGLGMTADLVEGSHAALNQAGVAPADVAEWALAALRERRFWALPPDDDVFSGLLAVELDELHTASAEG